MINLDPSILDRDKVRREKRRHLLKLCAAPIAIIAIVATFFLSSWGYNLVYLISYSNHNYPIAQSATEMRFLMNVLEPYLADYNQGVALMRMGDFKRAEDSFTRSIEEGPPEDKICQVYENLSLSIEKQADSAKTGGRYSDAIEMYSRAQSILYVTGCAGENDTAGKSQKSDAAEDRIAESKKGAINEMNNSYDDLDSTLDPAREKEVTDDDIDQIKRDSVAPNYAQGIYRFSEKDSFNCSPENGDKCW